MSAIAYANNYARSSAETARGRSQDEKRIRDQYNKAFQYSARVRPDLSETFKEIDSLSELPLDWDAEGAEPISRAAMWAAKCLIFQAATVANSVVLNWHPPVVVPNPDGGIDLSWHLDNVTLLIIIPPCGDEVAFVYKRGSKTPERLTLPLAKVANALVSMLAA